MHRPKLLRMAVQRYLIKRLFPGMVDGKTAMVGWMPIGGRDDNFEMRHEPIDQRNDFVAMRNGQRPTWEKIVLDVDQNQGFHARLFRLPESEISNFEI